MSDRHVMTREQMIDAAVRKALCRGRVKPLASARAILMRASLTQERLDPFGCMPHRLAAIREEFARLHAGSSEEAPWRNQRPLTRNAAFGATPPSGLGGKSTPTPSGPTGGHIWRGKQTRRRRLARLSST